MDTRDFNDSDFYSSEFLEEPTNDLQSLSPELYEIVTSTPEENESKTYDDKHLDNDHFFKDEHDGMDAKYLTLLKNIHKFHPEKTDDSQNNSIEESEIHDEDNDVMHPLISLTAIKPNSMRLTITPKKEKYSKDSMVRRTSTVSNSKLSSLDDIEELYCLLVINIIFPTKTHYLCGC